jgi:hypothetical protein
MAPYHETPAQFERTDSSAGAGTLDHLEEVEVTVLAERRKRVRAASSAPSRVLCAIRSPDSRWLSA